jgi:hypothetical protein
MTETLSFNDELPVSPEWLQELLPVAIARCRFRDPVINGDTGTATATRDISKSGVLEKRESLQLVVNWHGSEGFTVVSWSVFDYSHDRGGIENQGISREFQNAIRFTVYGTPEPRKPPHNPEIAPGGDFEGFYSGNLKDYSFCATASEAEHRASGVLPLGVQAYGEGDGVWYGNPLYLGDDRTGKPLLYKGVLVCAPQNSGKTALIVRWARAANQAGYNVLIVDVKGNLHNKLFNDEWRGEKYYLTTAPVQNHGEPTCDRINFLAGLLDPVRGITAVTSDRIKQLATALLPSEGWTGRGGKDEFFYINRVIWLTALIHILLLKQIYYPWKFSDDREITEWLDGEAEETRDRAADLSDLYELALSEAILLKTIEEIRQAETIKSQESVAILPECGVDYWERELALLIDAKHGGSRPANESYQSFTAGIKQALEPFARHGTLHRKIKDNGSGRLFRLEALGARAPAEAVTILLAAREQDRINAETLLSLTIARLQQLLFDRMPEENPRPILLLLDETRRIRGFEANQYITFAREAKAGCVIVYQSLDQIGMEEKIYEILENVGTQIYLGSLVGNTAKYFINLLPKRYRANVSENLQQASGGSTRTRVSSKELIDAFSTNELYKLPAGNYPAIVYISDQPREKPILVDMDESKLPNPISSWEAALNQQLIYSHTTTIQQLQFWPDHQFLAVGGEDESIVFLRLADYATVSTLPSILGGSCFDISPEGNLIITGKQDGRVMISSSTGSLVKSLEAHTTKVTAIAFIPSIGSIASADESGLIVIHDCETGSLVKEIHAHQALISSLICLDSRQLLLSASWDGTIHFWQYDEWRETNSIDCGKPIINILDTGDLYSLIIQNESELSIYSFEENSLKSLVGVQGLTCIAYAENARVLAIGFSDGSIQFWNGANWQPITTQKLCKEAIKRLAIAPNGHQAVYSSQNKELIFLPLPS